MELGLAEELNGRSAVNALWRQPIIATAAIASLGGPALLKNCRKPQIMADAAYAVVTKGLDFTGKFLIDEQVLRAEGVEDFSSYAFAPGEPLRADLFVDGFQQSPPSRG